MQLRVNAPPGFSFHRTVLSHGWVDLAPFELADRGQALATVVALPGGGARRLVLRSDGPRVILESPGVANVRVRRALETAARRILALDVDLTSFHDAVRHDERFRWIAETGSGRLLRAPSTFEDIVKLVLTTNCSWAFTKQMTAALVARYGEWTEDGARSFPTPERLARVGEQEFRRVVRAGYRSPYLAALARAVASREVDPEAWEVDTRPTALIRKELVKLPGVGPYVAENLLKYMGRPDGLALDSAMRARYAQLYHGGRRIKDRTIVRRCARLGSWAGLALWFDLTRDEFEPDRSPGASAVR